MTFSTKDIRMVVGLDFGTTFSGFAYCHISESKDILTNESWPGKAGTLKTNTVLQYDSGFNNVVEWGSLALTNRKNKDEKRPVELFKLYLGNLPKHRRPKLPPRFDFKKAITDYLYEIGKLIKKTVEWPGINFTENVLLVLTVPAEYSEREKKVIRKCAYNAKLIKEKDSQKLQFTTEPEAAAIYCILQQQSILVKEMTFMIVDCGGGTVDLTTHRLIENKQLTGDGTVDLTIQKLIENKQLTEVTERIGDFCGSTFIDNKFIEFLREKLGTDAMDELIENNYGQYQLLVQEFCQSIKKRFAGNKEFFYELDIDENAPSLLQYVSKEKREIMKKNDWLISIKHDDLIKMFDPIVDRIIRLMHIQLSNSQETCSAIFLVGGFSKSKYLQKRIKNEFQDIVKTILVPNQPEAAIARGAAIYGLSLKNSPRAEEMILYASVVRSRVLKYTYGIKVLGKWKASVHPPHRKIFDDRIYLFDTFVKRGTRVKVDKPSHPKLGYKPLNPSQTGLKFELFKTLKYSATYHDEPGMELVGTLRIDLPDTHLACERPVTFGFYFGEMEITAFAKNERNGQNFQTNFKLKD
ncbi:actin-like ATPase domain-containing protein [Rhizophagus irregularis]|uniref:Actin-like ATPase domain-containing protein n=1 Tax=Rhizophagus irregularis TaxID=588596 RepID=A0A2I1FZW8_9GLOM|nr:actin-like ATPase domain-containing protein [Rhizophagus irregularis]